MGGGWACQLGWVVAERVKCKDWMGETVGRTGKRWNGLWATANGVGVWAKAVGGGTGGAGSGGWAARKLVDASEEIAGEAGAEGE